MNKNLIPIIMKELRFMESEEFRVDCVSIHPATRFMFDSKRGLMVSKDEGKSWVAAIPSILQGIVLGNIGIEKIPFIPKEGEEYYSYIDGFCVHNYRWWDSADDYLRLKQGVVFRTSEEARFHLPDKYKELTGKTL